MIFATQWRYGEWKNYWGFPSEKMEQEETPEEMPALMADLIAWYNDAEVRKLMTPVELAALFHYRYIRIHPFEDGNGRIVRLQMNYIFLKHDYPMIVIRSKVKKLYLDALGKADKMVGPIPSDGAQASLEEARDFVAYISQQMEKTLQDNMMFLNEKADSVWWHDGEMVTFKNETTINILKEMVENPKVTIVELAKLLGISENAIQKQLKSLQEKGYLQRNGRTRGGSWQVLLVSTT